MSTVVLTLVVVGGSIAVAMKLARSGETKPATEAPRPHRGRARISRAHSRPKRSGPTAAQRRAAALEGVVVVEEVPAKPRLLLRLWAAVALTALTATIGAGVALLILAGATFIAEALETAVK